MNEVLYGRRKTYVPYPSSKVPKFQAKPLSLLAMILPCDPHLYIDNTYIVPVRYRTAGGLLGKPVVVFPDNSPLEGRIGYQNSSGSDRVQFIGGCMRD